MITEALTVRIVISISDYEVKLMLYNLSKSYPFAYNIELHICK